jgi:hypothetical protein
MGCPGTWKVEFRLKTGALLASTDYRMVAQVGYRRASAPPQSFVGCKQSSARVFQCSHSAN